MGAAQSLSVSGSRGRISVVYGDSLRSRGRRRDLGGMDTSKHVFQLHGVNAAEDPVLRKKLRRKEMVAFFAKAPPTVIAIEACGGSHHWARLLRSFGHEVKR